MWPAVKQKFDQEGFRKYVAGQRWSGWRYDKFVWHNTAAPSLAQWIKSAKEDEARGLISGISRINSLERFFQFDNGWSGCPHLFIANDGIWVMNPLNYPGVHSPSWNNTSIGIEMIGDFSREDDDAGEGLKVKNNTIFATTILCSALGVDPIPGEVVNRKTSGTIFLHKQDWATTHDCPGDDIARDKLAMIQAVADLMAGGEHDPDGVSAVIAGVSPPKGREDVFGVVTVDDLSFRTGPGVANPRTGALNTGIRVMILDRAANTTTEWLKVKTPAGYTGWVAGKFVKQEQA